MFLVFQVFHFYKGLLGAECLIGAAIVLAIGFPTMLGGNRTVFDPNAVLPPGVRPPRPDRVLRGWAKTPGAYGWYEDDWYYFDWSTRRFVKGIQHDPKKYKPETVWWRLSQKFRAFIARHRNEE